LAASASSAASGAEAEAVDALMMLGGTDDSSYDVSSLNWSQDDDTESISTINQMSVQLTGSHIRDNTVAGPVRRNSI
jgi:hypothetical protein